MQRFKHVLPMIMLGSICLVGTACHRDPYAAHATHVDKVRAAQIQALMAHGVDVIDLGQTIRLTFSSDRFFEGPTANLKPDQTITFERVAAFANSFPKAHISIIGYSDNVLPNREAKSISLAQAQAIAGFLWNDGLPSTRMQVEGKGYVAPLDDMNNPAAGAQNRRVEMLIAPAN